MNRFTGVFPFLLFSFPAFSQLQLAGDTMHYSAPAQTAIHTFHQATQFQKEIYSGPEHVSYLPTVEGSAYMFSNEWLLGSVFYNGVLYENELLKLDLAKEKLVVKRFDGFAVELHPEKVRYFTLASHPFIYANGQDYGGLKKGFYQMLASGALAILARSTKLMTERIEDTKVRQRFVESVSFYALKNNEPHLVKNLDAVLDLIKDKKSEAQQALKKSGVRFKRNQQLALVTIADYYNKNRP